VKYRWYVRGEAVLAISSFDGDWRFATGNGIVAPYRESDVVVAGPHGPGARQASFLTGDKHWVWRIDAADGYLKAVGVFDHTTVDAFPTREL